MKKAKCDKKQDYDAHLQNYKSRVQIDNEEYTNVDELGNFIQSLRVRSGE